MPPTAACGRNQRASFTTLGFAVVAAAGCGLITAGADDRQLTDRHIRSNIFGAELALSATAGILTPSRTALAVTEPLPRRNGVVTPAAHHALAIRRS